MISFCASSCVSCSVRKSWKIGKLKEMKMKLDFVSLSTILALLYGGAVFAKDQQGESLVNQRRKQFESYGLKANSEYSQASSLSQQLEQLCESIQNNQKWIKDTLIELRHEIQEAKQKIDQIKHNEKVDFLESENSVNKLKQQVKELIQQLERDVREEFTKPNLPEIDQNRFSTKEDIENNDSDVIFNNKIVLKDWMTTYYHSIKDKLIKDIVIPGTHDSGTAAIPEKGAVWSSDGRGVSIAFSEKDENFSVPWSKTQDLTIKEQLDIGVRFFDFRVSVEEGKRLYLSHGLRGEKLSDSLTAISEFCKKYPKELVIIKVKGFPDKQCKKANGNQLIVKKFEKQLDGLLISKKDIQNLPLTKYSDLIEAGNVVVLFDARISNKTTDKLNPFKDKEKGTLMKQALKETDWLFDGECLESHHANTVSTEKLFDFSKEIAKEIESDKSRKNKLFALHWTLTANAKYIAGHTKNAYGIRYLTSKLNGGKLYKGSYRLEDLIKQIPRVNIVQHDFIDKNKSAYLVRLNLKNRQIPTTSVSNKVLQRLRSFYNGIRAKTQR